MNKIIFKKKPIVCLTAYNRFSAELIDSCCDLILVGDSLGMAYYGHTSTRSVSLEDIIRHAKSVKKGISNSLLVVDMPFGTYRTMNSALKNAKKIVKETKCDAVKLEGGIEVKGIIKNLVKNNINVMGHVGLMPQKVKTKKDYKIKGKKRIEKLKILNDLESVENAGAFAVVLEAVKHDVAEIAVKKFKIPIIGIGATNNCDGQILVLEDMLGFFSKVPKFVKKYMNFQKQAKEAVKKYCEDVRSKKFPSKRNIYI